MCLYLPLVPVATTGGPLTGSGVVPSRWLVAAAGVQGVQDVLGCLCLLSALNQPQEEGVARSSRFSLVGAGAGAGAAPAGGVGAGAGAVRKDERFVITCKS